ncbi:diacylglycerol/lipid kinase family protein [Nakamurella sp. GG22]
MTTTEPPSAKRWAARIALILVAAAAILVFASAGYTGVFLVVTGLVGAALLLVGMFWFLARRGVARWAGLAVAALAVVALIWSYAAADVILVAILTLALLAAALAAARWAVDEDEDTWMPSVAVPDAKRPFFVMNPRSGGGKVVRFGLREKAEALGAEVALLEGPGHVDVAAVVRDAVARGADLLGVAGGDGTQALVAGIAAEHDLPFLVVSAGTRNHFALDLGLDRDDPSTCLDGLRNGVEVRVDLGMIGGRPFVNNASFGAYAEIVQSPEYRDHKEGTILSMLPDLLTPDAAALSVRVGDSTVDRTQAILVSNNPYGSGRLIDLGRRNRLDQGVLGVVAGRVDSAASAVGLLRRTNGQTVRVLTGPEAVVDADATEIPVGVDGEALMVPTPVHCTVRPRALRVRLPRNRPGVPRPKTRIEWDRLWRLAFGRTVDPVRAG